MVLSDVLHRDVWYIASAVLINCGSRTDCLVLMFFGIQRLVDENPYDNDENNDTADYADP